MLLQAPAPSPYDLEFRVAGFPVRISWTFWLMAAVLGYSLAQSVDRQFRVVGSPGTLPLLLLWALCVLLSILVHELGHAWAFRRYGIASSVVLYHFGGLAIPTGTLNFGSSQNRLLPKENIVISAAGPAAQLALAAVVILAVRLSGYEVLMLPTYLDWIPGIEGGKAIRSVGPYALVNFIVWPSVAWAILNLVPIYPLDGGQIARELIVLFGGSIYHATVLSLISVGLLVWWAFQAGQPMVGIMFLSLGAGNLETLQSLNRWR